MQLGWNSTARQRAKYLIATNSVHYRGIHKRLLTQSAQARVVEPIRTGPRLAKFASQRSIPAPLSAWATHRSADELPPTQSSYLLLADTLPRLSRTLGMEQRRSQVMAARLMEAELALHLRRLHPELLHLPAGTGGNMLRRAKAQGVAIVVEQRALHRRSEQMMLGGAARPRSGADLEMEARMNSDFDLADKVVCASKLAGDSLVANGVDGRKIETIALPNDPELFKPQIRGDGRWEQTALFVGPWTAQKGSDSVAEAIRSPLVPSSIRWLVPRSGLPPAVVPSADRLDLFDRHARSEMPRLYGSAKVAIVASLVEAYSMAALESMACGTPVIVSSGAGIAAEVERFDAGWIYPAGDAGRLCACLASAFSDQAAYERKQRGALRLADRSTEHRYVEGLLALYRSLSP